MTQTDVRPTYRLTTPKRSNPVIDWAARWREQAACLTADETHSVPLEAWTLDMGPDNPNPFSRTLKRICEDCPVRWNCLEDAVVDRVAQGVRGGYPFNDGGVAAGPDGAAMRRELGFRVSSRMQAGERERLVRQMWDRVAEHEEAEDGESRYASAM